jgi:UPF0755 protein
MIKLVSRFFALLSIVVFVACLAGFAGAFFLYYWGQEPFSVSTEVVDSSYDEEGSLEVDSGESKISIKLERGQSLASLSQKLESEGVISSALLFQVWVRAFSDFRKFQAGTYRFSRVVSPNDVAQSFINGEVYSEPLFEINIPEGYTVSQVVQRFLDRDIGTKEEFARLSSSQSFLRSLSISAPYIEGYLYPATYRFYEIPDEAQVFTEMVQTFWKKLPEGYELAVASRGITLSQAIILASLIEAETPHEDEKSMVSEVIWQRLARGMTLGIDAAVIYGAKDYQGVLRKKHLEDRSNPYNLRIYQGLPPTPITSPSASSLKAVLTPTSEGYLYYVVDPDQGTRHTFTKTLEEHNKAVRKLVQASKNKK